MQDRVVIFRDKRAMQKYDELFLRLCHGDLSARAEMRKLEVDSIGKENAVERAKQRYFAQDNKELVII